MARPVTLMTAQWADLELEEICRLAKEMGYDGLEIASWGQLNVKRAAQDPDYVRKVQETLEKYGLICKAIAAHLPGQCVGDIWDKRLDGFAPAEYAGCPEKIREWGIQEMKYAAKAARNLGVKVVTGFMGSPIWKMWYSFPQTTDEMIEEGYRKIRELWQPIFDEFDACGVKFALEVHPTEIAFDYWSTKKLLEVFHRRPALGINFDPSHLIWQGIDPAMFLYDFMDRVYHVHIKDAAVNLDGRNGILGSHINFGDPRRGWNFVSPGHGDVDFDKIIRVLNAAGYDGPLSIEWEDGGMDRVFGATEACSYTKKINFSPSEMAFDSALKTKEGQE
ncbi:Hydroxypyruvate isomerase [uncultured Roseburia sp.]|uniref:Sugar phosphate isomerase/epimerase n=1 Tax=Brotonthovivens ammoniilytica TaxID=2981725 RepID=A0ABT2TMK3_9FIRM|nr:sugar phosphate isomerase/epimerase family protein [Brotonthovivens ammoniilytica]MCU6763438.1 sugar phosphate isomerase/epimerase [Brotonthovivens ammoniilytica]SCJ19236.1 Hydroxypyruvate isomerase [uncultured Roseburia sp.]